MAYNPEKYRTKREKVLGVKKRGISFSTIAALVSCVIVLGLGTVVVPKSIAFFSTRHLEDAIYKIQEADASRNILPELRKMSGIKDVVADTDGTRIVITFNKSATGTKKLTAFFDQKGVSTIMLNQVGHSQRMTTMKKEAKF